MRLQRLTGLEREKIDKELKELYEKISWIKKVLSSTKEVLKIILEELKDVQTKFSSERKTKVVANELEEETDESLVSKQDVVVTLTHSGMVKRIAVDEYRLQKRGGKGLKGTVREEDSIRKVFSANTHTSLLLLSDRGRLYWSKVLKLPKGDRITKGKSIRNFCQTSEGENVLEILPTEDFSEEKFILYTTKKRLY